MLCDKDYKLIDIQYFEILHYTPYLIVLHSRNTGHDWCIKHEKYSVCEYYMIQHRHNRTQRFHKQDTKITFSEVLKLILEHDEYQINKRKKSRRNVCEPFDNRTRKNPLFMYKTEDIVDADKLAFLCGTFLIPTFAFFFSIIFVCMYKYFLS